MHPRTANPNTTRLAAVSAAQLGAGLLGLAVALKRRHAYDFLFLHGHPDHVARDALLMGTAFSAPATMLVAQAVATARLWRSPSRPARLVVAGLGMAMVPGYLGEKLVRRRLTRLGYEPLETRLVIAGIQLAALMALLGLSSLREPTNRRPRVGKPREPLAQKPPADSSRAAWRP